MFTSALAAVMAVAHNTSAAVTALADELAAVPLSTLPHATLLLVCTAAATTTAYMSTSALEHPLGVTSDTGVHRSAVGWASLALV